MQRLRHKNDLRESAAGVSKSKVAGSRPISSQSPRMTRLMSAHPKPVSIMNASEFTGLLNSPKKQVIPNVGTASEISVTQMTRPQSSASRNSRSSTKSNTRWQRPSTGVYKERKLNKFNERRFEEGNIQCMKELDDYEPKYYKNSERIYIYKKI